MSEQYELEFGETDSSPENYEVMSTKELENLYLKAVKVSPRVGTSRAEIIQALNDPESERARLGEIDKADDLDDIKKTYRSQ